MGPQNPTKKKKARRPTERMTVLKQGLVYFIYGIFLLLMVASLKAC